MNTPNPQRLPDLRFPQHRCHLRLGTTARQRRRDDPDWRRIRPGMPETVCSFVVTGSMWARCIALHPPPEALPVRAAGRFPCLELSANASYRTS